MKHLIILGDGMADRHIASLGNRTLLQHSATPSMDRLAREGRAGLLDTIPEGFSPGSEVANTAILGYDLREVYEGRGPLEAASIGYEMQPDDLALRCNIISLADGRIKNHHGGHLSTADGTLLIEYLQEHLGSDRVKFIPGIQYRHLLVIKGGNKHISCAPPHDNAEKPWMPLLPSAEEDHSNDENRMTAEETATLLRDLITRSQELLENHPFNANRRKEGKPIANSIWPWSPGYRPDMTPLKDIYPSIKKGAVITAVDLIRGIGIYSGLTPIDVPGATGLYDTDYEGKATAAINALKDSDFVFLHIEAPDEAGHDGDINLKIKTIEDIDRRVLTRVLKELESRGEDVCIALLPDHFTPVETRDHVGEPVPFVIWHKGIEPDSVTSFDEDSCAEGCYGVMGAADFMKEFMKY